MDKILEFLGKKPTDIAKKKHGDRKDITYGALISALITHDSLAVSAKELNIHENTLYRFLKEEFPTKDSKTIWRNYLLDLISMRKCWKCGNTKNVNEFPANKLRAEYFCKECQAAEQVSRRKEFPEVSKEISKTHYETHKDEYIAKNIKYNTKRKLATAPWADLTKIKEIYKNCPDGHEVDHIVPLQGALVSGLHVETNLQYLLVYENRVKGNR